MNLSEPLAGITSEVEAATLRVLARSDAGFSGRQVHQLAGVGSTTSVHRALTRFVRVGLVDAESRPPAIIYRPNRRHVLWPVIESALDTRSRVFADLDRFCREELPGELDLTIVVYGSVARRESSLESDLDLFVVYPDGIDPDAQAEYSYRLEQHAERLTGNETQIYAVTRSELRRRERDRDPLLASVIADGIVVHGSQLPTAQRRRAS
ncbi:nucleotidyltransferase domain-containing protein [Agromyces sp. H66]|uniref:nucleotidyltransferase domain-containing protein n=1 Tax=Agromyces sp. H66 TaxID=2529859 RepID=UPI0010AA9467|nr:nucleotidyltransferase domain-containing protein [Agromyces sp. H66]